MSKRIKEVALPTHSIWFANEGEPQRVDIRTTGRMVKGEAVELEGLNLIEYDRVSHAFLKTLFQGAPPKESIET